MTFLRNLTARLLAGCSLLAIASAQDSDSGSSGGASGAEGGSSTSPSTSTGSGASSSFGGTSETPANSGSVFGPAPVPPDVTGFEYNPTSNGNGTTRPGGASAGPSTSAGAAPAENEFARPVDSAPPSFAVSTGYGQAPVFFVGGEGRLARPRFRTRLSTAIGFDDNIFQTPTKAEGVPDQVVRQQVTAGTEDQVVLAPVERSSGPQQYRTVVVPGQEPQFEDIVIPGTPRPKRQGSVINRATIAFDAQVANRRSLFTFDLNVNGDYYWQRPQKKEEYTGSLALIYLYRLTPRMQFTASVNTAYRTQPDYSQINTPTGNTSGSYLTTNAKFDLSYRWMPRFSTVTSVSYDGLQYEDELRQAGDYRSFTIGNEFRYLWSPRVTTVLEGRLARFYYPNAPSLESTTIYALLGLDFTLSRRASSTIRVGESLRTFEESDKSSATPYLEAALTYQLGRASVLLWSNRFGFEEPPDPNTEVLTLRSGITLTHSFSARMQGSLGLNYLHRSSTNDVSDTESTEDTVDGSLNLNYALTRHWKFNMNYSYTLSMTDPGNGDFYRNRVFLGVDYEF